MGRKRSDQKIIKTDIALEINRAFLNDDMDKVFSAISTYMYFSELTVSSETILRLSEDGLISPSNNLPREQWPYKSKDLGDLSDALSRN